MVVQAGPLLSYVARELPRTCGQEQSLAYCVYYVLRDGPASERAEIAGPVLGITVRERKHRVLALGVELYIRIALVVL